MLAVHDLGLIEYSQALDLQNEALNNVQSEGERLFICEHPAVITVGRGIGAEKEIFTEEFPVFEISRGGRSTLHLPGQIVVYPILDLKKRGRDLHAYMRTLEEAIIETLADFRVTGGRVEGKTGVWVGERKIASLGIAVRNWVTYHGLALNVVCDLGSFSNLSPCGLSSSVMTSVKREISPEYWKTWKLTDEGLMKRLKLRLVENLLSQLSNSDSICRGS